MDTINLKAASIKGLFPSTCPRSVSYTHLDVYKRQARSLVLSVHPLVEEWIRIHGMKDMEQEFGAKIRLVSNPSLAVGVFTLLNAPDGD